MYDHLDWKPIAFKVTIFIIMFMLQWSTMNHPKLSYPLWTISDFLEPREKLMVVWKNSFLKICWFDSSFRFIFCIFIKRSSLSDRNHKTIFHRLRNHKFFLSLFHNFLVCTCKISIQNLSIPKESRILLYWPSFHTLMLSIFYTSRTPGV